MFRFSLIEEKHFKSLLRSGKLDDLVDEIINQFWVLEPSVQYEVIRYIKERNVYPSLKVVTSTFNISEEDARNLLTKPFREFKIPVVGQEDKLIKGISIKGLSSIVTNLTHLKDSMENIKKYINEGFAIFFEHCFSGDSYMLPAVLSMTVDNIPEDLVFTGKIDERGNIYEVGDLLRKRNVVNRHGLRLFEPRYAQNVKTIEDWLCAERYDVPFYITKTVENFQGEINNFYSCLKIEDAGRTVNMLNIINGISQDFLIVKTGRLPAESKAWESKIAEIYKRLKNIESKLGGKDVIHIAMNSPVALAFALGTIFGDKKPFFVYHYQNGVYYPIEISNVRYLRERVKTLKEINYKIEGKGKELAIIIAVAPSALEADVKRFTQGMDLTYLIVTHRRLGNIPVEEMPDIAREIAILIQNIRNERSFNVLHFFFSSPIPIAFMLGIALGQFNLGYVYNHQNGTYEKVIDLQNIRKIREEGKI